MNRWWSWCLVGLLLLSLIVQAGFLFYRRNSVAGFRTLPILIPVSLEYERAMRAGSPNRLLYSGEDLLTVLGAMERLDIPPDVAARLGRRLQSLIQARDRLLEAREQRHALNVALMGTGVAVARELQPDQWDYINMHRDQLRGKMEAQVFQRLMEKLR